MELLGQGQGFFSTCLKVALDGPSGFLIEDALKGRHVDRAIARHATAKFTNKKIIHFTHAGRLFFYIL